MSRAWSYITSELAGQGWQVEQQPVAFRWRIGLADDVTPGGWWPIRLHRRLRGQNLLASLPGAAVAGPPLVIAAHVDTVKDCPGADDNASSVAVLLELAALLRTRVDVAVLLAFLDMEEVGHFGGLALADRLARAGGAIGMVNLEMVGYFSDEPASQELRKGFRKLSAGEPAALANLDGERRGDFLLVMHRKSSALLAQRIRAGAQGRLPVITMQDPRPERWGRRLATFLVPATSNFDRSDHVPFWKRGIPAIMLCDTAHLRNKNYHRPTDTPDTLDYQRMAAVADAVAHLAAATALDAAAETAGRRR